MAAFSSLQGPPQEAFDIVVQELAADDVRLCEMVQELFKKRVDEFFKLVELIQTLTTMLNARCSAHGELLPLKLPLEVVEQLRETCSLFSPQQICSKHDETADVLMRVKAHNVNLYLMLFPLVMDGDQQYLMLQGKLQTLLTTLEQYLMLQGKKLQTLLTITTLE